MQQTNKVIEAQEMYNKVREKESISLIDEVVKLLTKYEFTQEQINIFITHRLITSCSDKVFEVQRVNVNRFWNTQLMQSESETVDARFHLLPDGSIENWLIWFEKIIKFIKDNGLPREL